MTLKKSDRKKRYSEILHAMLDRRIDDAFQMLTKMYADDVECYFLGETSVFGWRPIETAPIDEWCLFLDGNKTMRESFCGQNQYIDKIIPDEPGQTANAYIHNYTHWMPLPGAPVQQRGGV